MSKRFKTFNRVIDFIFIELMESGNYTKEQSIERARQLAKLPKHYWYTLDSVEKNIMDFAIKGFPNFARFHAINPIINELSY